MNYFVDSLKEICGGKLDILIDTRNTKVGDDINQFSDKIKDCICVIVIMTPSYKIKVLEEMDFVYNEFKVIINKMNQQHEIDITMEQDVETSPIARFEIIPILFSGDINTSVPKEFKNLLYEDFRELKVSIKKGKSYILKSVETKFQKRIKSISEKITASALLSLSEFQNYYEEYFKTLFKESKSEWSNPEYQKYIDDLFVKTDVFKKVMQQVLSYIELSGILKQVDIRVSSGIIEEITIQKKIEFLYQIGFLGIVVSEQVKERFYMVNRHAFIFNESSFVFDQYSVEELEESSFVIHPVFCEHLQLDTKENDELILQFDWDYLHTKEWLRNVAQDF